MCRVTADYSFNCYRWGSRLKLRPDTASSSLSETPLTGERQDLNRNKNSCDIWREELLSYGINDSVIAHTTPIEAHHHQIN